MTTDPHLEADIAWLSSEKITIGHNLEPSSHATEHNARIDRLIAHLTPVPEGEEIGLRGPLDTDTPLMAAAREAAWALMEIVDGAPWEKRQQIVSIAHRLGVVLAAPPSPHTGEVANLTDLPMDLAPRHGTMVWLLIDHEDDDRPWAPLVDAVKSWTIGFNNFDNDEMNRWHIVGWSWTQDCFVDIEDAQPLAWRPVGFNLDAAEVRP